MEEQTEVIETVEPTVSEKVYSIKEIMELLDGLEVVVDFATKILADGRVDFSDIVHLQEIAVKYDVVADAVTGLEMVLKEAKDIDQEEFMQVMLKLVGMFKKIKAIRV